MSTPLLPIQKVSELTGVNPVTLRAWERRYGLLTPLRTDKGHRRYRSDDVKRVLAILQWLDKGVAVSRVAALLDAGRPDAAMVEEAASAHWQQVREQAWQALQHCHSGKLDALLGELLADYGPAKVVRFFCLPLQQRLAASPLLAGQRLWLESRLQAKWASRLLALAPQPGQFAWLVIPLDSPLLAQQVGLVMNRPLWCLPAAPSAQALQLLLAERHGVGVLWVAERPWRGSDYLDYWLTQNTVPRACWCHGLPVPGVPAGIVPLSCDWEQLPEALQSLEQDIDEPLGVK